MSVSPTTRGARITAFGLSYDRKGQNADISIFAMALHGVVTPAI